MKIIIRYYSLIYYSVHLAGHESQPLQNIIDTLLAVRSSKDTIDTILDAGSVPALVPCIFDLSFAHDDLVQTTGKLVLELGISWLSRGNSHHNSKAGKDSNELGHPM